MYIILTDTWIELVIANSSVFFSVGRFGIIPGCEAIFRWEFAV